MFSAREAPSSLRPSRRLCTVTFAVGCNGGRLSPPKAQVRRLAVTYRRLHARPHQVPKRPTGKWSFAEQPVITRGPVHIIHAVALVPSHQLLACKHTRRHEGIHRNVVYPGPSGPCAASASTSRGKTGVGAGSAVSAAIRRAAPSA